MVSSAPVGQMRIKSSETYFLLLTSTFKELGVCTYNLQDRVRVLSHLFGSCLIESKRSTDVGGIQAAFVAKLRTAREKVENST